MQIQPIQLELIYLQLDQNLKGLNIPLYIKTSQVVRC